MTNTFGRRTCTWLLIAATFAAVPRAAAAQMTERADTSADTVRVFADLASFFATLPAVAPRPLDRNNAVWLSAFPLSCLSRPHGRPNPAAYLWEVTFSPLTDFRSQRSFYGCYDWHSAVNSAWTLVTLLKAFPDLPTGPAIRLKLDDLLGAENLAGEVDFYQDAGTFELPYGYAWLLRLQGELRSWDDPDAARWASHMQPLAAFMAQRMITYLDELEQPNRSGVHPNTAMAMDNALDYALAYDPALERAIRRAADRMFASDTDCPTAREPGGSDFASPCLMEAAIMSRLLPRAAFLTWLDGFLPPIHAPAFRPLTVTLGPEFVENPTALATRSHIISLAFVRAKSMGELANALPAADERVPVFRRLAAMQADKGYRVMAGAGYWGSHFLATWAVTYMITN